MPRDTENDRAMQSRALLASNSQMETIGQLDGVTEGYAYRARLCDMIKSPPILKEFNSKGRQTRDLWYQAPGKAIFMIHCK